ncbi:MAG: site-specific integrase [Candidatus Acidiferrales bacterium]
MTIDDLEDMGSLLLIKIPNTKTKKSRTFTVLGDEYLTKYRKYFNLRPHDFKERRFFLKYQNGKCYKAVMGIHKIGSAAKDVALYLNLPNWKEYTGHCLRRTSATMLVDNGGDITTLKRHGGWKSDTVAEGYIEDSVESKSKIAKRILQPAPAEDLEQVLLDRPTTSKEVLKIVDPANIVMSTDISRSGGFLHHANVQNCTFTININNK